MVQLRAHRMRTTIRDIAAITLLYAAVIAAMALLGLTHIRVLEWGP